MWITILKVPPYFGRDELSLFIKSYQNGFHLRSIGYGIQCGQKTSLVLASVLELLLIALHEKVRLYSY